MGIVDWNDVGNSNTTFNDNSGSINFLKLASGGTYTIRPLGKCVEFNKYFLQHNGRWRSAICSDIDTCPVRKNHNVEPSIRYAVSVIDRADGLLKIMEGPVTVFKPFRMFSEATGFSPGGVDGADFEIKVTGAGKKTRYIVKMVQRTPFTSEEKAYLKEQKLYNLERIYKATDPEEIENVLFGDGPASSSNATSTSETNNDVVNDVVISDVVKDVVEVENNDEGEVPW